jgi:hypothetical protein
MSTHHNPTSEDLPFVDISQETYREYELANGNTYHIENPVALFVREESGNHRVLSFDSGRGRYISHHVPGDGRRPIRWEVEPGSAFFRGWGEAANENVDIVHEVQPGGDPDSVEFPDKGTPRITTRSTGLSADV